MQEVVERLVDAFEPLAWVAGVVYVAGMVVVLALACLAVWRIFFKW